MEMCEKEEKGYIKDSWDRDTHSYSRWYTLRTSSAL